jgi:hypothetical protein
MLNGRNESADRQLQLVGDIEEREKRRIFRLAHLAPFAATEPPVFGRMVEDARKRAADLDARGGRDFMLANEAIELGRQSLQCIAAITSRRHRRDLTRQPDLRRGRVFPLGGRRDGVVAKWQSKTLLVVTLSPDRSATRAASSTFSGCSSRQPRGRLLRLLRQ